MMINASKCNHDRITYTPSEAAAVIGRPRTRIFKAIKDGELTARKDGRATLIENTELLRWVKSLPTIGINRADVSGCLPQSRPEEHEIINATLTLFEGRCGHRWVGARDGSYACPVCNDHDGDHHLVSMKPIAAQPEDWGHAWGRISDLGDKRWSTASAGE